jgi:hypothetical protein
MFGGADDHHLLSPASPGMISDRKLMSPAYKVSELHLIKPHDSEDTGFKLGSPNDNKNFNKPPALFKKMVTSVPKKKVDFVYDVDN